MLSLRESNGVLCITIGLASGQECDVTVRGSQFGGKLGQAINRLVSIVRLACSSSTLGGVAAREELSWVFWPTLASRNGGDELEALVHMVNPAVPHEISVHLILPENHPLMELRQTRNKLDVCFQLQPLNVATLETLMLSAA